MRTDHLIFEHSPWFILLCLLLGACYAFFLYQKKGPWSKRTHNLMAFLRFSLATIVAILILEPLIEQIKNSYAPPTLVFAIDNSQSVAESLQKDDKALLHQIGNASKELEDEGYAVVHRSYDQPNISNVEKDLEFDQPTSNIDNLLKTVQSDYEGRNLAGVVLLSDGIYNRGISPEHTTYGVPIYSIGLGDTIPKTDVKISRLYYNKVSYQGNKFPVIAEVQHNGFSNERVNISIIHQGKTVLSEQLTLDNSKIQEVEFLLEAKEKGLQHYTVKVDTLPNEFSIENNSKHAYIEVIEGKENILLAAPAPHPDIKAITNALKKNENYEVTLYIPGIHDLTATEKNSLNFDVVIQHQFPSIKRPSGSAISTIEAAGIPTFYIVGSQTNISNFNNINPLLNIHPARNETDQVLPSLSTNFSLFKPGDNFMEGLKFYPQIKVPFGNYVLKGNADVMLFQKVGSVITEKPLLIFGSERERKYAILTGEGIWQWRIQEKAQAGAAKGFDDLIHKTVQYLSAKEDKRRFRVYPVQNEFDDTDPVVFEAEVYNEIFEPVFNQTINLELQSEEGQQYNYQFTTNPANTSYRISGLQEGIYTYTATTTLGEKRFENEGEFSVKKLQLENLNLTANHNLLRNISRNSQGEFYFAEELDELKNALRTKEAKSIIYTDEEYLPVINLWWVFILLLILISVEWFLRKYNGSY